MNIRELFNKSEKYGKYAIVKEAEFFALEEMKGVYEFGFQCGDFVLYDYDSQITFMSTLDKVKEVIENGCFLYARIQDSWFLSDENKKECIKVLGLKPDAPASKPKPRTRKSGYTRRPMLFDANYKVSKHIFYHDYLAARMENTARKLEKDLGVECRHIESTCAGMSNYLEVEYKGHYCKLRISDHQATSSCGDYDQGWIIWGYDYITLRREIINYVKTRIKEWDKEND